MTETRRNALLTKYYTRKTGWGSIDNLKFRIALFSGEFCVGSKKLLQHFAASVILVVRMLKGGT